MNITYYGHSCFEVKINNKKIIFDPFILSGNNLILLNIGETKLI